MQILIINFTTFEKDKIAYIKQIEIKICIICCKINSQYFRYIFKINSLNILILERWPSGLRRTLGKRVCVNSVTWVRIPLSPHLFDNRTTN